MIIDPPGKVTDRILLLGTKDSNVYLLKGEDEYDQATDQLEKAGHPMVRIILEDKYDLAIENFKKSVNLTEARGWVELYVIPLVENMDQKDELSRMLSMVEPEAVSGRLPIILMINAYGMTGMNDEAFKWLERGFKERDYAMVRLKINPYLKPLHSDPRWQELLDKVGFPD